MGIAFYNEIQVSVEELIKINSGGYIRITALPSVYDNIKREFFSDLSFDDFIEKLNKQSINFKIDPDKYHNFNRGLICEEIIFFLFEFLENEKYLKSNSAGNLFYNQLAYPQRDILKTTKIKLNFNSEKDFDFWKNLIKVYIDKNVPVQIKKEEANEIQQLTQRKDTEMDKLSYNSIEIDVKILVNILNSGYIKIKGFLDNNDFDNNIIKENCMQFEDYIKKLESLNIIIEGIYLSQNCDYLSIDDSTIWYLFEFLQDERFLSSENAGHLSYSELDSKQLEILNNTKIKLCFTKQQEIDLFEKLLKNYNLSKKEKKTKNIEINKDELENNKGEVFKYPYFLVIEGPDCSGKSTLVEALYNKLKKMNIDVVKTKQINNHQIRELFLQPLKQPITLETVNIKEKEVNHKKVELLRQMFLAMADRIESLEEIKEYVNKGCFVICDRNELSTLIYQADELAFYSQKFNKEYWRHTVEELHNDIYKAIEIKINSIFILNPENGVLNKRLENKMNKDLIELDSEKIERVKQRYIKESNRVGVNSLISEDINKNIEIIIKEVLDKNILLKIAMQNSQ